MKYLTVALLLSLSALFCSQAATAAVLQTHISDDGNILSVRIQGRQNGREINFDRQFVVRNLSTLQKEIILCQAFASVRVFPPPNQLPWLITTAVDIFFGLAITLAAVYRVRQNSHLGI